MIALRLLLLCAAIALGAGCADSDRTSLTPTSPSPESTEVRGGRPSPPGGSLTIAGVVTERLPGGGARPLAGVNVNAWVQTGSFGYSYWWANGSRRTDASGRYELTGLPHSATVLVDAWVDDHAWVQQCAAPPKAMSADATVDIELVARDNVAVSPEHAPQVPGFRSVSGVIFENSPEGKRPVQGVHVNYEHVMDSPAAHTFTDAQGRYLLCGIPANSDAEIGAGISGRVSYATARPGQTRVDLVLP